MPNREYTRCVITDHGNWIVELDNDEEVTAWFDVDDDRKRHAWINSDGDLFCRWSNFETSVAPPIPSKVALEMCRMHEELGKKM